MRGTRPRWLEDVEAHVALRDYEKQQHLPIHEELDAGERLFSPFWCDGVDPVVGHHECN